MLSSCESIEQEEPSETTTLWIHASQRLFYNALQQDFKIHVAFETYVILGNDALLKCEVPSFVSDLVDIFGWIDNGGNQFLTDFNYG